MFSILSKAKRPIWSISIYEADSFNDLKNIKLVKKPVLTAKDVNDMPADFVADPFVIKKDSTYYMFFEVLNRFTQKGSIGLATSKYGKKWSYDRIVLNEEYHMSYPYVFKYGSNYFMIPECGESGFVKLYKAEDFPLKWVCVANLIKGCFADASLFNYKDKFYMLLEKRDKKGNRNCNLHLYYSEKLGSGWKEHCKSPIIKNNSKFARPAGRVFKKNDKLYRFAQNNEAYYGEGISVFEILCLNVNNYKEKKLDMYFNGSKKSGMWNESGMHHIDIFEDNGDKMITCFDGHYYKSYFTLIFTIRKKFYNLLRLRKNIFNKQVYSSTHNIQK